MRDILFFLLTTIYLLCVMLFLKEFNIYSSFGLLLIYALYVVTVVVQNSNDNKESQVDKRMRILNEMVALQNKKTGEADVDEVFKAIEERKETPLI